MPREPQLIESQDHSLSVGVGPFMRIDYSEEQILHYIDEVTGESIPVVYIPAPQPWHVRLWALLNTDIRILWRQLWAYITSTSR